MEKTPCAKLARKGLHKCNAKKKKKRGGGEKFHVTKIASCGRGQNKKKSRHATYGERVWVNNKLHTEWEKQPTGRGERMAGSLPISLLRVDQNVHVLYAHTSTHAHVCTSHGNTLHLLD
ncbi:hypothetical protein POVWA2_018750 [Plasmodium ovale wallikeri]|uniref:Uncharacterized protein n=1 Tax=Plasmodium ovale wallikeri TaxID=864142 RepID=A0A1A8YRS4_PLAOA|nr:hypothetical protein POVWA2_018750 [Plasmodium ovale wallikeri]